MINVIFRDTFYRQGDDNNIPAADYFARRWTTASVIMGSWAIELVCLENSGLNIRTVNKISNIDPVNCITRMFLVLKCSLVVSDYFIGWHEQSMPQVHMYKKRLGLQNMRRDITRSEVYGEPILARYTPPAKSFRSPASVRITW